MKHGTLLHLIVKQGALLHLIVKHGVLLHLIVYAARDTEEVRKPIK